MKALLAVVSLCLILTSCKKDDEQVIPTGSQFTAKVGAANWTANEVQASIYNGTIVVIGESLDGTAITISLNADTTGLYPLTSTGSSTGTYSLGSGKGFSTAGGPNGNGEVLIETINSVDGEISGSFQFDAIRNSDDSTVVITEGKFSKIKYSNLPLGVENNSLSTDLNGETWTPIDVTGFVAFRILNINAFDADGTRSLSFEIPDDIGPGKYELNYFTKYKAQYITSDERTHYAVRGELEVTSHNLVTQEIEAIFNTYMEEHEGTGIARFSNGKFKITYE